MGIGANTATFSFADGLLLRPLPVPNESEVVSVGSLNVATGGTNALRASYPDYADLREATTSVRAVSSHSGRFSRFIEYVRVIAVMLLVTGLAAYLPARRAVRIEPTQALRYE